MKVIFLRHGQSAANLDESLLYTTRDADIPLTAEGKIQAQEAGEKLAALLTESTEVIVSSFLRARQTWEAIEPQLPKAKIIMVSFTPEAGEQNYNLLDPRNVEGFKNRRLYKNDFDYAFFGGESLRQTYHRAELFYKKYLESSTNPILLVSHCRFLQMLRLVVMGLPIEEYHQKYFTNCEILEIEK